MQEALAPKYPILYGAAGHRYCDLLLDQGKAREVLDRAGKTLYLSTREGILLDIALDHLSLGRAHLALAEQAGTGDFTKAQSEFDPSLADRFAAVTAYFARKRGTRRESD